MSIFPLRQGYPPDGPRNRICTVSRSSMKKSLNILVLVSWLSKQTLSTACLNVYGTTVHGHSSGKDSISPHSIGILHGLRMMNH
jgi:hypothetical protein